METLPVILMVTEDSLGQSSCESKIREVRLTYSFLKSRRQAVLKLLRALNW